MPTCVNLWASVMTNLTFPSSTIMQGFGDLSLHMPPSSAFTNFLIPRLVVVDLDGTDIHLRVGCALSCALFDQCCVSAPLRRISYKVTCLTPCDSRKIQQTCFQWTKALNFLDCCTFQFHCWHAPRTLIWRHWRLSPWRGGESICMMCMYPTAFWGWKV